MLPQRQLPLSVSAISQLPLIALYKPAFDATTGTLARPHKFRPAVRLLGLSAQRVGELGGRLVGLDVDHPGVFARPVDEVDGDAARTRARRPGETPGDPVTGQFVFVADQIM